MAKKFVGNIVGVSGGNKKQRSDVFEMVFWYLDRYMRRFRSLDIDIELVSEKNLDDDDAHGWADKMGRRKFEIELNKNLKGDDFTTLVFHELCHVEQWAKGLLTDLNKKGSIVKWRGFIYENYSYTKQPWERQAYRKQEVALKYWKKYKKSKEKKILTIDIK